MCREQEIKNVESHLQRILSHDILSEELKKLDLLEIIQNTLNNIQQENK